MATKKAAKQATKKSAKKSTKKTTRKAAARKAPAARKRPAKKAAPRKTTARKTAARKSTARKATKKITPRNALANTRKLLEAKQQHARETPPWQQIGAPGAPGHDGYQSPEAQAKANELHAGEVRMDGNHGSISTHDRHAQGRRDSR